MSMLAAERIRLFGTSGVRGVVGQDLTAGLCHGIGRALGTCLAPRCEVCLATDTRESRQMVKEAVVAGILSTGVNVADLGILPTPALAVLTREKGFSAGIMLTASHNPPEYNGIKLFDRDSTPYRQSQEQELEERYSVARFRPGRGELRQLSNGEEEYLSFIQDKLPASRSSSRLKLVVDPGNGAASGFVTRIFSQLGLNVIPLNDTPDGRFPGRSPEPNEETLQGTIEFLRQKSADLAVCFDGDGDRVVFCDREGFLGLNEMIAFIARLIVGQTGNRKVATTVETGRLLDLALESLGAQVVRGRVGDVHVAHLARDIDAALGVEGVGVYIFPELGYYPDSIFAALILLSHLDHPDQIRGFFQTLPDLFFHKAKVPCPDDLKHSVMSQLADPSVALNAIKGHPETDLTDGLRLDFRDSWLLIRPSGTEPVFRVIAEATSKARANDLMKKGTELVRSVMEASR